mgnify:CR=1 FL=1
MRVKLDKVCKRIYAGGDVPKGRYSTVKTAEYAIPIYANAEKDNGLYGYTDTARENELSITVAARGTIGFTAIRREPFLPVVRLITVVPDLSTVSERYLYYALRNCKPAFSGTSIPQLTVPDIKKNEIELYSLSVQETIADKLDAVGRIIELRQQQLQKLDDLVKARFVELFGDPVGNPKAYYVATLQELICKGYITYHLDGNHGGDYPKSDEFVETGIPYISANCIVNGEVDFAKAKYLTSERANKLRKGIAQNGDVLFAHNATVGPTVVLHTTEKKVILGTSLTAYRCDKEKILPNYLKTYMLSDGFVRQYSNEMKQTTRNQVPITAQKKYLFLIPPIELQNQFATFVEQVDKSKVAVQKSLNEAQLLFDSLMQQYFG